LKLTSGRLRHAAGLDDIVRAGELTGEAALLFITTSSTFASLPSRSAMFARISAMQQSTGASRLTVASPVAKPTFSGPRSRQSAIHFSLTRALIGQV
jgi:hypothetical protein